MGGTLYRESIAVTFIGEAQQILNRTGEAAVVCRMSNALTLALKVKLLVNFGLMLKTLFQVCAKAETPYRL